MPRRPWDDVERRPELPRRRLAKLVSHQFQIRQRFGYAFGVVELYPWRRFSPVSNERAFS